MVRSSIFCLIVAAALATGCSSTGADICERFKTLCSSGTSGATVTTTCDEDAADDLSNGDDVKSCLDKASDCNGAVACMLTGKK